MITAFFRTAILYLLLIVGLRITGKRQIGELEPIELVLTMMLSDLASVPMQDFAVPLLYGVIPILTLLSLSTLLSYASLRSVRLRRLMCGEPALIIDNGRIIQTVMRRNRLTLDELLEELRGQGVTDPATVKYAVLETSGKLSVLLYSDQQPATPQQMGKSVKDNVFLPTILINDGRIIAENLQRVGLDGKWLEKQLKKHQAKSPTDVFFLSVDNAGTVTYLPKEGQT
ncbi:MAG: DUF421 domain-containing protein [Oscillospiraceae bacterium]|nr:DUF421 domain-containing protein [Oscillospiraceae bacterium]